MTKREDRLVFDFTGSSPQADRGVNCTRWGAWGGLLAPLYPLLCYDIVWNEGVLRPVEMIAPEGTIVNCRRPAPVSIATRAAVQAVNNVSLICISKMLAAHPTYRKESTAVWHGSHLCLYLFAHNRHGDMVTGSTTETFGGSGGTGFLADGIDVGGEIPNPISRMANVETNETMYPIRYLFRRRMQDSSGAGWHKGGTGGEYAIVPHDGTERRFGFVVSGKGVDFPMGHGLAGGYPGNPGRYVIVREAGTAAREDGRTLVPLGLSELSGKPEVVSWGVYNVEADDTLYVRWNGAGGYGDPLERDPEAVARDIVEGVVSRESTLCAYGVVTGQTGVVDPVKARLERKRLRDVRCASAKLDAQLLVSGDASEIYTCCSCGFQSNGNNGTGGFRLRERPLSELGSAYTTGARAFACELICPNCSTLVETQVANRSNSIGAA
jgi:N-methylhydantoinase B